VNSIRYILLFTSSFVLITSFQNCGQPGALNDVTSNLTKADAPLVADVVGEMQNQNPPVVAVVAAPVEAAAPNEPAREQAGYIKDEPDSVVYDNELENVLQDHSCQENSKKVLLCHYPRGNPENRHEICISRSALQAHLRNRSDSAHLDHLGACPE